MLNLHIVHPSKGDTSTSVIFCDYVIDNYVMGHEIIGFSDMSNAILFFWIKFFENCKEHLSLFMAGEVNLMIGPYQQLASF